MVSIWDHGPCPCTVWKHFGCIRKLCWPRFRRRMSHEAGVGRFEDHLNMLIKTTKIANPTGGLEMLRSRLEGIATAQINANRNQMTLEIWGTQEILDWQMTFLDRCVVHVGHTFLVNSPRWQIGYVEIV